MGFFSTNLLKVIEWQDNSKDTIVYKFPMDGRKIMNGSKLTVRESQIAIFVNKGKIADIFEPGMYKLETSNLPVLTQLMSWPYGFKSPFLADVYFINLKQFTQKWGTSNPIAIRDKEFGTIRIRGYGSYAFKVDNPKVFLNELFGTNSTFLTSDIEQYLRSMLVACISDTISESKISALDMASNLFEFSDVVRESIANKFTSLGLTITNFIVENISFPEEVEKAIDARSSLGVLQGSMDSYVKYNVANAMGDVAKNQSSSDIAGVGVSLGTGLTMANMVKESVEKNNDGEPEKVEKTTKKKAVKYCKECGAEMPLRAKFCNECGAKQVTEHVCPNCGVKLESNDKFCNECGTKIK